MIFCLRDSGIITDTESDKNNSKEEPKCRAIRKCKCGTYLSSAPLPVHEVRT